MLTDFFEGLAFGLRVEEVYDDSVADAGADVYDKVLVAEVSETVRGDLGNDDVVHPVTGRRDGCSEGTHVHREDLGLVDPRH